MPNRDPKKSVADRLDEDWIDTVEGKAGSVREADIYPKLQAWAQQTAPSTVLEIGCGQGACSQHVAQAARRYFGIDSSSAMIARANELYSDARHSFVVGTADKLPFCDDSFDATYSVAVWHLLEDLSAVANELGRVLKTGGNFLIMTANPANYSAWKDRYEANVTHGKRFEGTAKFADGTTYSEVLHLHTLGELTASLEAADLTVNATETFRTGPNGLDIHIAIRGHKCVS